MFELDAGEVSGIVEALRRLAAVDVAGADEQVLCDAALALESARRFLDATQCHVLGELEARGVTDRAAGQRTSAWLAHHAGLPSGVARQRVRVGTQLRRLGALDERLRAGAVGFDHARVIADAANPRIVDDLAQLSGELCDLAEGMVFDDWRREVHGIAEQLDQDGGYDPDRDLARNRLRIGRTGEQTVGHFELIGARGALVEAGLNTIADELFERYSHDNQVTPELPVPSRATLMGLALEEVVRRALAINRDASRPPRTELHLLLTPDQLDAGLRGERTDGRSTDRLAEQTLGRRWTLHAGIVGFTLTDAEGRRVRTDPYAPLTCDAAIYATVVDSLGVPLDMGRQVRFATTAQRRALAHRDGGCTFPGCAAPPAWTDAHHRLDWARGGRTDLDQLVSACRHHHGVAHRPGWSVEVTDDGWTRWTTRGGHQFWGQRHHRQRAGPLPHAA